MNQEKMQWQAPVLEVLDVNETMSGIGWRQIDWVSEHDADLLNPS